MSIFISYSHKDQDYVNKLVEALAKQELPWWVDNKIDYGDQSTKEIEENLKKCQVFLLVMSPSSEESDWVQRELTFAQHLKKPIFPLLLDGEIWFQVINIQIIDVKGGKLPPDTFFNKVRSKLNNKTIQLTAEEWFNLGNNKRESGDNQGAIADYDQAIQIKPDYAEAFKNRGNAKSNLGDYQGAIADYDQAIQIKPDYALAYNNRGNAKSHLGDYQGAIADFNQAIKIKPNYALAYNNRGNAKKNLGDNPNAIADYDQAIKIKPDYASAYINRGLAKKNLGDKQAAIADYNQAIRLKPDYADAYSSSFPHILPASSDKTIKNIRIFLASSAELESDREQFEIFISRKNREYIRKEIFLELVIWEDFLDAMSATRLQDEYNKAIAECDIFVSLFHTKVGKYTEEEFFKAFATFKENNKPFIYTYFKDTPINMSKITSEILSLLNFREKLSELGHFYTIYSDINDLKYKFDQQLIKLNPHFEN